MVSSARDFALFSTSFVEYFTAMSEPQSWSGPGLILAFIDTQDSSKVTIEAFRKWWMIELRPAMVATGAISSGWSYKAANPVYDKQHIFISKVSDLARVHAGVLTALPRTSKLGYFEGDLERDQLVRYESRIYSLEQLYEASKQEEETTPTILIDMMEPSPGGEAELDNWYREEHNQQMSQELGWKRTTRFRLLFQHGNGFKESEELSFLAIHEFSEENKLGKDVKPLEPVSDRTKKVLSGVKAVDAAIYHKQPLPQKK